MPALADLAWRAYNASGPALMFVIIVMLAGAWKVIWKDQVEPWLEDLEAGQEDHADELTERAIGANERDVLLEDAHERLDQAHEARGRLRKRLTRLERHYAADHGMNPDDLGPTSMADGGQDDLAPAGDSDD